jgi:[glutamine synthetase] adenylyltransferase / [glutamine synthetase]-adenylyl-L-tyrosine phosphorylase
MQAFVPTAAADHSRFVQRIRRRYPAELALLAPGEPDAATQVALIDALGSRGLPLADTLRIARQLILERLVVLDVEQGAPLDLVTRTMSAFAEVALERALAQALADADARHGPPLDGQGQRIDFWIVGMGKLAS